MSQLKKCQSKSTRKQIASRIQMDMEHLHSGSQLLLGPGTGSDHPLILELWMWYRKKHRENGMVG